MSRIGGIGLHSTSDYEYYRIVMELKALGISPTGNKSADKARLMLEKEKLVNKISKTKSKTEPEKTKTPDKHFLETLSEIKEENLERQEMEKEKLGAMTIAELNRYYFRI